MLRSEPLSSSRRRARAAVLSWPLLRAPAEAVFRGAATAVLGELTFGMGGHVVFMPAKPRAASERFDDDDSWSTRVELRIDGADDRHGIRMNARRLLYLPCVILAALVLASPLSWRRKAVAFALGAVLLVASALLSAWLTAAWLFARVPGLVYELTELEQSMLNFGYEAWVTALGNRYLAPIVLAVALVLALMRGDAPAPPAVSPRPKQPSNKALVTRRQNKKSRRRNARARASA
jgi:hypothetical protein